MRHYLFDLEGTLIDTSELLPYKKTKEGKDFLVGNIHSVPTRVVDISLAEMVRSLSSRVLIVTNSPEEYARALLAKHGFPQGLPVWGAAGKPSSSRLKEAMRARRLSPEKVLVIGDWAGDVLAAHSCQMPSVGVSWGYSTEGQLGRAEPQRLISKPGDLEEVVSDFERGRISYSPRQEPANYQYFEKRGNLGTEEHLSLGNYYRSSEKKGDLLSGYILCFKSAKDITIDEVNRGATDDFFYGGKKRKGKLYSHIIKYFIRQVGERIDSIRLEGETLLIAAPNSFPEYCYKTDINQILLRNIAERKERYTTLGRSVCRVYPVGEAHSWGERGEDKHYRSIGLRKKREELDFDNIIIFDDVMTSGSQMRSIAGMLRGTRFQGRIFSLSLGQTA